MKRFRILVHFNGDGFDIPYLLKCCRRLGLNYDFDSIISLDIYKKIKPYRKLLGLENMKQKSIERFLGVSREDKCSGGELIQVYVPLHPGVPGGLRFQSIPQPDLEEPVFHPCSPGI